MTNFRLPIREFADTNFKFGEHGRSISERVENIMGKGEIAPYKQFFLFPQCFQNTCTAEMRKKGHFWERVKSLSHNPDS